MGKYIKFLVLISGLIFAIFFIFFPKTIQAVVFCSYQGPDVSQDFLRLTELSVSGVSGLKIGDTITVKFKLQNYGQTDLKLGSKGIFAAARDPQNSDVSFGFTRVNTTLKVGETVSIEVSKVLDKAGTWKIWPSYHLVSQNGEKFGPNEWHLCTFQVAPQIQDSDKDGVPEEEDNCPQNYNPQQEDMDGDGIGNVCDSCDDRDTDQDKIKNCLDDCPTQPENYNQYQDDDGCPDEKPKEVPKDSDGDGIPDESDKCPKEKETFNNYQDSDGCPDEVPQEKPKEEKPKEIEITPEFSRCVENYMKKINLSYEDARQKCSKEKNELIKDFAKELKEINLSEIRIVQRVKINSKIANLDGVEIPAVPVVVDVQGRNVWIGPSSKGLIIEEDGVKAEGDVEIEYENGKLVSGKSKKQINVLLSQLLEKIDGEIKEIKIEDEGTPKYLAKVVKKGKLFWFIPINFSARAEIDATNGSLKVKKPWWTFVVKILPYCRAPEILVSNSCCLDENYNRICDNKESFTMSPGTTTQVFLPEAECGDGQCYIIERNNCCQDCGCPVDFRCQENGSCIRISSRPFIPPSALSESYIVVTLDEMIIHDDEDPAAAGELQLITLAATGDKAQTMYWPAGLWRPVNSGNRVLGGNILDKIPVFSLKENQMGEKLAISFRAIDNDDLPNWLEGFIDILSTPYNILTTVVEALADLLDLPQLEGIVYLENQLERAFNELIADNETIGSVTQIYDRTQNWGAREEPYVIRRGGLTVKYTIHKISVPRTSKLGVKLWKVVVRDTGDYFDGEVWFWVRCANNFGEQKIDEIKYRIPRSGTFDWGDGQILEGVPGPTIEVSPGVLETTRLPIIECKNNGPFTFFEVAVWDEDEPNVGDDHDLIGHFTETVLYPETEIEGMLGKITAPRGNIDVWLEYTKE